MDLWCLQAEATLSFMAEKEKTLKDLSLTLPFFLLEVRARVCDRISACVTEMSSSGGRSSSEIWIAARLLYTTLGSFWCRCPRRVADIQGIPLDA